MFCFFFSSRRRHTRLQGDWSSDVCSSDLGDEQRGRERRQDAPWNCTKHIVLFRFEWEFGVREKRTGQQLAGEVYSVSYSASAAWSARRERSPRCSVTCPECDQPFMRSTT